LNIGGARAGAAGAAAPPNHFRYIYKKGILYTYFLVFYDFPQENIKYFKFRWKI
jgi:hypothetical protein